MPRFAANLWTLFTELDMEDRFGAAAAAGFEAVEMQFPYAWPAAALAARLEAHGLEQVLINAPAGDYGAGERGLAGLPGREAEFRASLERALDYAGALGCPQIHVMAGVPAADVEGRRARETLTENLRLAAAAGAEAGVRVLVEPLNPQDVPGYLIGDTGEALAVIEAAGADNLFLQYDLYHALMNGEDPVRGVRENLDLIRHMQVAGVPGRHEPDGGPGGDAVDYPALFDAIDAAGYGGWIGLEYRPRAGTLAGLGWAAAYGIGPQGGG